MYTEERNPFFGVRKERLVTESGLDTGKIALINDETENVLGLVSPNYELVTNESVFNTFDEAIDGLSVAKTIDHMDAETKRWKRFIVFDDESLNVEVTAGDSTGLLLEISNGFTGKQSFGYSLMGYRWLCENGQVMGKKHLFSTKLPHYADNPERLRSSFEVKFDNFRKVANSWKNWVSIPFATAKFDMFVDSKTKVDTDDADNTGRYLTSKVSKDIKDAYPLLLEEGNLNPTKWGAFNALTSLATHKTKARNGSNVFSKRYETVNRLASDLYEYA